jgi:hypothetical protein
VNPLELLVDAVAAYRLTRLVTADDITAPIRDAIVEWSYDRLPDVEVERSGGETWSDVAIADPDAPKLATLITCRWCTGVWVGAGVVAARRLTPRAWQPLAEALSLAAAAALVAALEE